MSSSWSRHAEAGRYRRETGDGEPPIELLKPRFARPPEALVRHQVQAGDRLDLLAFRYFGDPLQYWRIVDANPALRPEELLEVGRVLSIPRGG